MKKSITDNFISTYEPLVKSFIEKIDRENIDGIQEPFLPAFGTKYEEDPHRIAFIGMEGADNPEYSKLRNFIDVAEKEGCAKAIQRWDVEFKEVFWDANYYKNGVFWNFIRTLVSR